MLACWIIVLLIEIMNFYNTIHQVHEPVDTLFYIVLVTITLVVGAVGIIVSAIVTRNNKE